MKKVLILCTGNSCRSQMAQAIWQDLGNGEWTAQSAGSKPSGYVHPLALAAIAEIGLDTQGLFSKSVEHFNGEDFDLAVTVCDNAQRDCPILSGVRKMLHWPFADPADATGSDEEKMEFFRMIRDQIRDQVASYLSAE